MENKLTLPYKRLKIRYNKHDKKYTLDYMKVADKKAFRYDFLKEINNDYDLFLFIDTGVDMYQKNKKKVSEGSNEARTLSLTTVEGRENVERFLTDNSFNYSLRKLSRQVTKTIMGFSAGKSEMINDYQLAVIVDKGQLDKNFFNALCENHDYMLGINPAISKTDILKSISEGQYAAFLEIEDFTYNLVDAQWMGYFYTDLELPLLNK